MNLLFFDSIEPDVFGGVENWIGLVGKGLVARGHAVGVIGRPGSEFLRRTRLVEPSLAVHELNISGDFSPVTISKVSRYLAAHKIDVVIANFNKDIRLAGLAARWNGQTKVVWRAGLDLTKDNLVHRFLTPRLLDGVITPSHSLKRQITRLGYITDDMVRVIYTGIKDTAHDVPREKCRRQLRKKYNLPEDCLIAVTSGRFVNQKGHKYLVDAAAGVIARFSNIRFLLLGDGPLESGLMQQMSETGVRDNFIFAGLLDGFELELSGSDIMLHPSVEEPFGIALLEGMRSGLPIVASRVGGIPEVVQEGKTALLVTPRRSRDLTSATVELLGDRKLMEAFGRAGRQRWQTEFAYDTMLNKVEQYFRVLTDGESACE